MKGNLNLAFGCNARTVENGLISHAVTPHCLLFCITNNTHHVSLFVRADSEQAEEPMDQTEQVGGRLRKTTSLVIYTTDS